MQQENIVPKCLICQEIPAGGMRDGIYLRGHFICSHCERELLREPSDSEIYSLYCCRLRLLWQPACLSLGG